MLFNVYTLCNSRTSKGLVYLTCFFFLFLQVSVNDMDWTCPTAIVVGNEKRYLIAFLCLQVVYE